MDIFLMDIHTTSDILASNKERMKIQDYVIHEIMKSCSSFKKDSRSESTAIKMKGSKKNTNSCNNDNTSFYDFKQHLSQRAQLLKWKKAASNENPSFTDKEFDDPLNFGAQSCGKKSASCVIKFRCL